MAHLSLRIGTSLLVTAAVTALPVTALAYLSPSDVFGTNAAPSNSTETTVDPYVPPTLRDASSRVAAQQADSAVRRATAQTALAPENAPPATTEDSAPPADDAAAPAPSRLDPNVNYEIRQERISERDVSRPTIIITGNGGIVDSQGNVLHSGAPLITRTGPESVLAVCALFVAAVGTFGISAWRRRHLV